MKRYNEKETENINYSKSRKGIIVTEEENKIFNYGLTNLFKYKDEMRKNDIKYKVFSSYLYCTELKIHGSRMKEIADSVVKTAFVNPNGYGQLDDTILSAHVLTCFSHASSLWSYRL